MRAQPSSSRCRSTANGAGLGRRRPPGSARTARPITLRARTGSPPCMRGQCDQRGRGVGADARAVISGDRLGPAERSRGKRSVEGHHQALGEASRRHEAVDVGGPAFWALSAGTRGGGVATAEQADHRARGHECVRLGSEPAEQVAGLSRRCRRVRATDAAMRTAAARCAGSSDASRSSAILAAVVQSPVSARASARRRSTPPPPASGGCPVQTRDPAGIRRRGGLALQKSASRSSRVPCSASRRPRSMGSVPSSICDASKLCFDFVMPCRADDLGDGAVYRLQEPRVTTTAR